MPDDAVDDRSELTPDRPEAVLGVAAVALLAAVYVERRHPDALVPPRIVANRITTLSILASVAHTDPQLLAEHVHRCCRCRGADLGLGPAVPSN